MTEFSISYEFDNWEPGQHNPDNDNSDVWVTLSDESRWVATFFTYRNISSLSIKNAETGECLSGKYFWSSDMILIDRLTPSNIEAVVKDLLASNEFKLVFRQIPKDKAV